MKKNIYYRAVYGHKNLIREIVYGVITALANYPSLIIYSVFRRNMGERFYSLASSIGFAVFMLLPALPGLVGHDSSFAYFDISETFNWFWVLFTFAFIGIAILRRLEFSRTGYTFDTERFSYSEGEQMAFWGELNQSFPQLRINPINVSRYYEPLVVFLVGFFLALLPFTGITGDFLMLTAILHYGKVFVLWQRGREFVLNQIDEIIANEDMGRTFLDDETEASGRGFKMNCPRPKNPEMREKVLSHMIDESEGSVVS